jgi:hypothetical protein
MTKKEFKELTSYHKYTGRPRENNVNALFFDWKETEEGRGYKYCVYARACNATKAELENALFDIVTNQVDDTPWYIQLVAAPTDRQRFKVPIMGSGLNCLIKRY